MSATSESAVLDAYPVFWSEVERLTEAGELRRLSGAFARFVATLGGRSGVAPLPLLLGALVLSELEGRGHSCLLLADLAEAPAALLGWLEEDWKALAKAARPLPRGVKGWIAALAGCEQVWRVGDLDYDQPLVLDDSRLYLRRYWRDETLVAASVRTRALVHQPIAPERVRPWLDRLFPPAAQPAHVDGGPSDGRPDWQKLACAIAVRGGIAIITGGPGTGKTYTVARLLALLFAIAPDAARQRVALAAPTGKAAARLKQAIDKALAELAGRLGDELPLRELTARMGAARTLHSLLGARPDTRSFAHNRGNPLDVDVLIVDEASMVHLEMMAALLDALPPGATLVLLGDKDQLASVEAGAVLGDLCHDAQAGNYDAATLDYVREASGETIPASFAAASGGPLAQQTVMLRESRRFSGPIGRLALAVNAGDVDGALAVLRGDGGDTAVRWIEHAQPQHVIALAAEGYRPYLSLLRAGAPAVADTPDAHEAWVASVLQAFEGFRILCAVRAGEWGVEGLNGAVETRLAHAGLIVRGGEWYVGRPVMVTRNDYGTGTFNGDIGLTLPDPARPGSLRVYFLEGDKVRSVLATRLRHVETAFAMTVHKSQGSEFAHTVLALPKEGGMVLARELVYTGITRASRRFTLATPAPAALGDAILRRTHRASGLRGMLADERR
jgi:exodeoxyribonuclease V alpha subunit